MVHFPRELPTTALDLYFCEFNFIAHLSQEEEAILVEQARNGSVEAKQALIESCLLRRSRLWDAGQRIEYPRASLERTLWIILGCKATYIVSSKVSRSRTRRRRCED